LHAPNLVVGMTPAAPQTSPPDQLRPLEWGGLARAFWYLTYDSNVWTTFITGHVQTLYEEGSLWSGELATHHKFGQPRSAPETNLTRKTSVEVRGVTDKRHWGKIIAYHVTKGFGFIDCDEIKQRYHKDVLLDKVDVKGFKTQDMVSFMVFITSKGWPQAIDLEVRQKGPVEFMSQLLIDEQEFNKQGYMLHTTRYPSFDLPTAEPGDRVCISYIGRLAADGTIFDAAEGFEFTLGTGAVIAGLDGGIAGLRMGQEARLIVHHILAYGAKGTTGARAEIPPFAHLEFSVRLLWKGKPPVGQAERRVAPTHAAALREERPPRIVFVDLGGAGEAEDGEKPQTQAQLQAPNSVSKGEVWSALMRSVKEMSVTEWLLSIDAGGGLLQYKDELSKSYDSADQVVSVYARVDEASGSRSLEPTFFEDLGVQKVGHRRLFEGWFAGTP